MTSEADKHPLTVAFYRGFQSAPGELDRFRETAKAEPDNLERRAEFVAALSRHTPGSRLSDEYVRETLWWIEHHPELVDHVSGALHLLSHAPHYVFDPVLRAWNAALEKFPEDPGVTLCAANALQHHDPDRALSLYARAHDLPGSDSAPAMGAGNLVLLRAMRFTRGEGPTHDPVGAAEALRWFEKALERTQDLGTRMGIFWFAIEAAFATNQLTLARGYAQELLDAAAALPTVERASDCAFTGNNVLGRIALREGDVERAKEHLARAGVAARTARNVTFKPELALADELLQRGERDAVLSFLRTLGNWKRGEAKISFWTFQIERGETPRLLAFGRP